MKKTKIVCTMGPNTNDREMMRKLIQNGMNVARFNFSHGDHEEQKFRMDMLKELREEEHTNTAILLDTKGPEIRTGILKDGKKITLKEGETFTLTTEDIVGDNKRVSITYKGLVQDIYKGCTILIDDGLIGLRVESKTETEIVCSVVNGGELGERKGVNVPNVAIRLPAITEKDKDDNDISDEGLLSDNGVSNPEFLILKKEDNLEKRNKLITVLSPFEQSVCEMMFMEYDYRQIAAKLNKEEKVIDNAMQRIKLKAKKIFKD